MEEASAAHSVSADNKKIFFGIIEEDDGTQSIHLEYGYDGEYEIAQAKTLREAKNIAERLAVDDAYHDKLYDRAEAKGSTPDW